MRLDSLQRHWQAFGERDPLWAVLTEDHKKDNRWTVDDFMASGEQLVGWYVARLKELGIVPRFSRALDFGCGVGRVTQGLAAIAGEVTGVDIAPAMVARARECNRFGARVRYAVNERDDLRAFADGEFDLVHSTIVVQHMHPIYQRRYLGELLRVLAPGGVLILQSASDFYRLDPPAGPATRVAGPLPAVACRGRVTGLGPRLVLPVLGRSERLVTIENLAKAPWPALGDGDDRFQIKLGARWRRWAGAGASAVVHEGMRTVLPGDVPPRTPTELPLVLDAPEDPGHYLLEVDLLQEEVGWFADRGPSSALLVSTVLTAEAPVAGQTEPQMEMYCVPRPELTRRFADAGADLVRALPSDASGPGCSSHYYFVRKSRGGA
jgi:SAM-dependent methyltransferase